MSEALERVKAWLAFAGPGWDDKAAIHSINGARLHMADLRALVAELDWRPIEEAPKDGTRVLIAGPGLSEACIGFWVPSRDPDKLLKGGWTDGECNVYGYEIIDGITDFRPLPAPPKGTK